MGEVKVPLTGNHMTEEAGKDRVHTSVAGTHSMQKGEPQTVPEEDV